MKFENTRLACLAGLAWLSALLVAGCDPKLTAGDDGGNDDGPDPVVTPEALAVGNIVSLQAQIVATGLSIAAEYDTAGTALRAMLPTGCWTLTELDAGLPSWGLDLGGCTDAHGTSYRGGGQFDPVEALDGYAFFPWYDVDLIRAENETNDDYAHNVHSGSIEIEFERSAGAVSGADIGKYLRHFVRNEIVTFTWDNVHYAGPIGSFGAYPDAGSIVRVVWDAVGIFDVTFDGGGARYSMQGATYQVDLSNGNVSIVQQI